MPRPAEKDVPDEDVRQRAAQVCADKEAEGKKRLQDTGRPPRGPQDYPTCLYVIEFRRVKDLLDTFSPEELTGEPVPSERRGPAPTNLPSVEEELGVKTFVNTAMKADGYAIVSIYGELEASDKAKEMVEVADLQLSIAYFRGVEEERTVRKAEIEELFSGQEEELQNNIDVLGEDLEKAKAALELLENPPKEKPPPPGPQSLMWVMSEYFNLVATTVIISNLACMVYELVDKEKAKEFFWLDQFFMIFYVMEIVVKAVLLRSTMLFGEISVVWWNWLDLIIVISGVMDMWMQPLLMMCGVISGGHSLKALSFLRMLRLLRILKIVGMFLKADTRWSQSNGFQLFIMGVIGFNSVLMGLESDIPDFGGWFYVEQILLVIFSSEVSLRIKFFGCEYFYHKKDIGWNLLDFTIVAGGVVDQWMMPAIGLIKMLLGIPSHGKGNLGQIMMMLRMARLLRILRLVRLIKSIPPLYTLVVGIMQAIQGMMWVVALTALVLYVCALLGVKLIGHGMVFGGPPPPDVAGVFPSMFDSMFVCFKAMNGDWGALEPLFIVMPITKFIFFLYTVLSTWGILAILTAVVSENMINATEAHREEQDEIEKEAADEAKQKALADIFNKADTSSEGAKSDRKLSKEEFHAMLKPAENGGSREALEEASGLDFHDLRTLFKYLSGADEGSDEPTISQEEFITGLTDEGRCVTERSILRLENTITYLEDTVRGVVGATLSHEGFDMSKVPQDVMEFLQESEDPDTEAARPA